jgi:hypothetical protein
MTATTFNFVSFVKRLLHGSRRPAHASRSAHPYHSVSIRVGKNACAAAKEIVDHRFLAADAPHLPLVKCDAERCTCAFAHYEDRRQEGRRAEDNDARPSSFAGRNARTGTPRRREDQETTFDSQYFEFVGKRRDENDKS